MRLRNVLPFLALAWLLASNWGWFRVQERTLTPDEMADAGEPLRTEISILDTTGVPVARKFEGERMAWRNE